MKCVCLYARECTVSQGRVSDNVTRRSPSAGPARDGETDEGVLLRQRGRATHRAAGQEDHLSGDRTQGRQRLDFISPPHRPLPPAVPSLAPSLTSALAADTDWTDWRGITLV